MAKRKSATGRQKSPKPAPEARRRPSALLDTRVIYCGDNLEPLRRRLCQGLEQLAELPERCVDLICISQIRRGGEPPSDFNRNYEVFWGELTEPRPSESGFHADFESPHASPLHRLVSSTGMRVYIDYMSTDLSESGGRPRGVERTMRNSLTRAVPTSIDDQWNDLSLSNGRTRSLTGAARIGHSTGNRCKSTDSQPEGFVRVRKGGA